MFYIGLFKKLNKPMKDSICSNISDFFYSRSTQIHKKGTQSELEDCLGTQGLCVFEHFDTKTLIGYLNIQKLTAIEHMGS